jgi:acetoin utilization protein AcuC
MKTALIYHGDAHKYGFGKGHPFNGERFKNFFDFFSGRFAAYKNEFDIINPAPAADGLLELVHSRDYIKVITAASQGKVFPDIFRYVSPDNVNPLTGYIPPGIEEGARIVVGAAVLAGELVAERKYKKAIAIGGGMHHAKPDYGEGFCFYNDVAICVRNLKQKYSLQRILVLDTDAHAGNGTMEIFYEDPQVLFIDIHQDPRTIYPGTGFLHEIGKGKGEGFTVNLALLPRTGNKAYEYLFEEVIFPLAQEYKPEAIIRYGGSDPHYMDELTALGLTLDGFRMIGRKVFELSEELTGGRSIDLLLSGYNQGVLPYAWAALVAGLLDLDIDLSGLKEESKLAQDSRLSETKDMVKELKKHLKKYWKCL